jgi:hypothetical protein
MFRILLDATSIQVCEATTRSSHPSSGRNKFSLTQACKMKLGHLLNKPRVFGLT